MLICCRLLILRNYEGSSNDIYVRIRKTAQKECACYFVSIWKIFFSVGFQAKQNVEKFFYYYSLSLFGAVCGRRYVSIGIEKLLEECLYSEEEGAFPANIYLAVLCGL